MSLSSQQESINYPGHFEPLYQTLIDEFTQNILTGELKPGDCVPSIRILAKERKVSVITVKRAYMELERKGLITTRPGVGSFVAEDQNRAYQEAHAALEESLRNVIAQARILNISDDKLATLFYRVKQYSS